MKPIKLSTVATEEVRLPNAAWVRGILARGRARRTRAYWLAQEVLAARDDS